MQRSVLRWGGCVRLWVHAGFGGRGDPHLDGRGPCELGWGVYARLEGLCHTWGVEGGALQLQTRNVLGKKRVILAVPGWGGWWKFGARVIKEHWRPSTGAGGTEPAPSPGEVPLAHCPQEELGGLLGGAGREQPRLLQGAQGPGTRHLGELGARRSLGEKLGGLPRQGEARGDAGDSRGGGCGDAGYP